MSTTILLASSELHPYSKTGGLADMVGALSKYLAQAGLQVVVVTPLYAGIRERFPAIRSSGTTIPLMLGHYQMEAELWYLKVNDQLVVLFVDQPHFYDRPGLYQENGRDYGDNADRFIFFSKAIAHIARSAPWRADVVHVHDWQTGLAPLFIRHQRLREGWDTAPRTCFTIHNQAYQGVFPVDKYALTNLPWDYFSHRGVEFYGQMNCLKTGIVYSDLITTVSSRYAREITTEQFGCGLDGVLRERQNALTGILNGVDYEEWNTEQNPHLSHPYSAEHPEGKAANKAALQREMGLPVLADVPLFGSVTRLADQKGVDIALDALEEMAAADLQFVLLGSGQAEFERGFRRLAARHPSKIAVRIGYDHALSHRIEAASDFFLMPSKFEPCGLNQLYSLRYGTIPVVHAVGGLDDSIIDVTEDADRANGIKFYTYTSRALAKAIRKALVLYQHSELLAHYRWNGMTADFSWERTAQEYLRLYERLLHPATPASG